MASLRQSRYPPKPIGNPKTRRSDRASLKGENEAPKRKPDQPVFVGVTAPVDIHTKTAEKARGCVLECPMPGSRRVCSALEWRRQLMRGNQ